MAASAENDKSRTYPDINPSGLGWTALTPNWFERMRLRKKFTKPSDVFQSYHGGEFKAGGDPGVDTNGRNEKTGVSGGEVVLTKELAGQYANFVRGHMLDIDNVVRNAIRSGNLERLKQKALFKSEFALYSSLMKYDLVNDPGIATQDFLDGASVNSVDEAKLVKFLKSPKNLQDLNTIMERKIDMAMSAAGFVVAADPRGERGFHDGRAVINLSGQRPLAWVADNVPNGAKAAAIVPALALLTPIVGVGAGLSVPALIASTYVAGGYAIYRGLDKGVHVDLRRSAEALEAIQGDEDYKEYCRDVLHINPADYHVTTAGVVERVSRPGNYQATNEAALEKALKLTHTNRAYYREFLGIPDDVLDGSRIQRFYSSQNRRTILGVTIWGGAPDQLTERELMLTRAQEEIESIYVKHGGPVDTNNIRMYQSDGSRTTPFPSTGRTIDIAASQRLYMKARDEYLARTVEESARRVKKKGFISGVDEKLEQTTDKGKAYEKKKKELTAARAVYDGLDQAIDSDEKVLDDYDRAKVEYDTAAAHMQRVLGTTDLDEAERTVARRRGLSGEDLKDRRNKLKEKTDAVLDALKGAEEGYRVIYSMKAELAWFTNTTGLALTVPDLDKDFSVVMAAVNARGSANQGWPEDQNGFLDNRRKLILARAEHKSVALMNTKLEGIASSLSIPSTDAYLLLHLTPAEIVALGEKKTPLVTITITDAEAAIAKARQYYEGKMRAYEEALTWEANGAKAQNQRNRNEKNTLERNIQVATAVSAEFVQAEQQLRALYTDPDRLAQLLVSPSGYAEYQKAYTEMTVSIGHFALSDLQTKSISDLHAQANGQTPPWWASVDNHLYTPALIIAQAEALSIPSLIMESKPVGRGTTAAESMWEIIYTLGFTPEQAMQGESLVDQAIAKGKAIPDPNKWQDDDTTREYIKLGLRAFVDNNKNRQGKLKALISSATTAGTIDAVGLQAIARRSTEGKAVIDKAVSLQGRAAAYGALFVPQRTINTPAEFAAAIAELEQRRDGLGDWDESTVIDAKITAYRDALSALTQIRAASAQIGATSLTDFDNLIHLSRATPQDQLVIDRYKEAQKSLEDGSRAKEKALETLMKTQEQEYTYFTSLSTGTPPGLGINDANLKSQTIEELLIEVNRINQGNAALGWSKENNLANRLRVVRAKTYAEAAVPPYTTGSVFDMTVLTNSYRFTEAMLRQYDDDATLINEINARMDALGIVGGKFSTIAGNKDMVDIAALRKNLALRFDTYRRGVQTANENATRYAQARVATLDRALQQSEIEKTFGQDRSTLEVARRLIGRQEAVLAGYTSLREPTNLARLVDTVRLTTADLTYTETERATAAERGYYAWLEALADYQTASGVNRSDLFKKLNEALPPIELSHIIFDTLGLAASVTRDNLTEVLGAVAANAATTPPTFTEAHVYNIISAVYAYMEGKVATIHY